MACIALSFCVSQAIKPMNTAIAINVIAQLSPLLFRKILTTDARITPISPIAMRLPMAVKSLLVVKPYSAKKKKVPAVTANVVAIEPPVYTKNSGESVIPFRNEYTMKRSVASPALMDMTAAESHTTNPISTIASPKNIH